MKSFQICQFLLFLLFLFGLPAFCQNNNTLGNFVMIKPGDSYEEIIEKAANVTPSQRQFEWQKMEFIAFIHFGINTFTNAEWGQKVMDISKFNPSEINVDQWVRVIKAAGMKEIILTAKHHDGFCLWPSKYNNYNISETPFENGKGDIVRDLSKACREAGLKFGIYLSPWDMHEKTYGTPEYNTYFENLLRELLTNYGKISEVWFDGANGEGPNGKKQVYYWQSYYKLIRKLQPNAVIAIMGPDVRWVGTESGYGRHTEWSVLPGSSFSLEKIAAGSQQTARDSAFIPRDLTAEDLGSRVQIEKASSLVWYPAEVDVSIRPGWFYHKSEDELVKSPEKLTDIYYNSVGLNDVLLLNIPPDRRGLITKYDIKNLEGMKYILEQTFKNNLAKNASAKCPESEKNHETKYILDGNYNSYWTTDNSDSTAAIEINLKGKKTFNRALLQENILIGQRIEKFHLEAYNGSAWEKFAEATTIGYKRLLRFPEITADKIKIVIDRCRTNPTLSTFGIYMSPPEVSFLPNGSDFLDSVEFSISSNLKNTRIFYTLDGSIPDTNSPEYSGRRIRINKTTEVNAIAVSKDGKISLPTGTKFAKAKFSVDYIKRYDDKYPGQGNYTLVDGLYGSTDFNDGKWQGFHGSDLDIVIDLGKKKTIGKISADFLNDINSFIFFPKSVEYYVSDDGKDFKLAGKINNEDLQQKETLPETKAFSFVFKSTSARFVRIKAENIGVCPPWHKGAGDKAWLFSDEIDVE